MPLPIIFRYLRGLYFNKCFICYFHSLQTLSSTQSNNYSFDYKVSYHVSHWDDRNENLLISTLRIPENSDLASHWVPPFSGTEIPTSWQRARVRDFFIKEFVFGFFFKPTGLGFPSNQA